MHTPARSLLATTAAITIHSAHIEMQNINVVGCAIIEDQLKKFRISCTVMDLIGGVRKALKSVKCVHAQTVNRVPTLETEQPLVDHD